RRVSANVRAVRAGRAREQSPWKALVAGLDGAFPHGEVDAVAAACDLVQSLFAQMAPAAASEVASALTGSPAGEIAVELKRSMQAEVERVRIEGRSNRERERLEDLLIGRSTWPWNALTGFDQMHPF